MVDSVVRSNGVDVSDGFGTSTSPHFRRLRGTAVVTLARAGCNEVEIYSITGHRPGDVQAILTTHYLHHLDS